jgi:hypothetical protein
LHDFVSVIMPVYNASAFLQDAVESVLSQTWQHLELIAIDDGSQDGGGELLNQWSWQDRRVRVVHQSNQGAVVALNHGLDLAAARGSDGFVAIMHADDVCLPMRLEKQMAYLAAHPEVDFCGTWMRTFGAAEREWQYPAEPRFTKAFLLFWCCFAHPTMMWRRSLVTEGLRYDPATPMPCEDYALWARASRQYQMANVPEVLLQYRVHAQQGGAAHREKAAALTERIRREQLQCLHVSPTAAEMAVHQKLAESEFGSDMAFVAAAQAWLEKLWAANQQTHYFEEEAFGQVLGGRWAATCVYAAAKENKQAVWKAFWKSNMAGFVDRSLEKNRAIPAKSRTQRNRKR